MKAEIGKAETPCGGPQRSAEHRSAPRLCVFAVIALVLASCATLVTARTMLTWDPSPTPNVVYVVYEVDSNTFLFTPIAQVSGTNYVLTNNVYGQLLTVTAKDISTGLESDPGNIVTNNTPSKVSVRIGKAP